MPNVPLSHESDGAVPTRPWHRWGVFVTYTRANTVLRRRCVRAFPFKWLAKAHANDLNRSPAILAESIKSLMDPGADGWALWADFDVERLGGDRSP